MTIEEFATTTAERIPTPTEFVAFAREQGWTFSVNGPAASLRVPDRNDPLAVAFARMLSREPYRTNVLAVLDEPQPPSVAEEEDDGIFCNHCRKRWYCTRDEIAGPHGCEETRCRL